MKKIIALLLSGLFLFACVSCSANDENYIDLTTMSSTMAMTQVQNMGNFPEQFVGKTIKMSGVWTREKTSEPSYSCMYSDATACCVYGLSVALADSEALPQEGASVTIEGQFELYKDGKNQKIRIKDAVVS